MKTIAFVVATAAVLAAAPAHAGGDAAAGKKTYDTLCANCHGATGKGDGPTGAAFPTKPRTFTDPAWQKSVDDARLTKVIKGGGPAVGLTPFMPPFGTLSDADVANAIAYIRGFAGK